MRVLVIDDETSLRHIIQRLLGRKHEIIDVEGASEAFVHLVRGGFDVILCDVHLPAMSGEEFLSKLSPHDAARVVFMTGGPRNAADVRFLSGRPVLYKPFHVVELEAALKAGAARASAAA